VSQETCHAQTRSAKKWTERNGASFRRTGLQNHILNVGRNRRQVRSEFAAARKGANGLMASALEGSLKVRVMAPASIGLANR
jgi:hypothetical protein